VKLEALSGGDHCWFKRITRKNRPVTREIIVIIIIMSKDEWLDLHVQTATDTCFRSKTSNLNI
jgi:hypothetical protein